ncbi:ABC transporter ATP-binding protein [Sulfuriflexus sp.]|uniref:ABC transporter ATP-binding protein n=1 Tax=Sulfuriflexus sp. TaxID=2015443 RepID=UPI0028CF116E|nr:ABC transporter ATP-binding protein [Sulfuriflexus sp.]MDT8405083.1 ABC transporter ATP-binding protein [Sulfuriflexus sp.]
MTTALHIEGLSKTYNNGFEALKGVSFEVREGDFYALLGSNGAGKSTTIGIISSLINKTAGKVSIFGIDIDVDFPEARTHLGLVPQEFNFNVFEPVEEILINQAGFYGIPRKVATQRAEHYLRKLGLWEKRRNMARNLSGGMKRRLMIARSLMHEPRLLILDEPTAGVDIEIRHSMWQFLREINAAGTTIILTTHYLEEAESLCRNIGIIDHGIIIEDTSMRQLLGRLQRETFVLDLGDTLTSLPDLQGCDLYLLDDHTLEVILPRGEALNDVFGYLTEHGIEVLSMRNKANRLEQLFMELVENSDARQEAT